MPRKPSLWQSLPIWQVLVGGYLTFGRSFAYLGVAPLFIGELFLAGHVVSNHRRWLSRLIEGCLNLQSLSAFILLNFLWGLFQVGRSMMAGSSMVESLRPFAFYYYPLLIAIGINIGQRLRLSDFLRFWRRFCVFYGAYAIAYASWGSRVTLMLPWKWGVSIFNPPSFAPLIPIGMLALWPHLKHWRWRFLVAAVGVAPIFYSPGRGTFLGLIAGAAVVASASLKRMETVAGSALAVLVLMSLIGPYLPGEDGRAENLDPLLVVARLVSTVNPDLGRWMLVQRGYDETAKEMDAAQGTAEWRQAIWHNAIGSLDTTARMLLGEGFGASLAELTPDGADIHSPHNFIIYSLYYTGAIGAGLFLLLLASLLARARRVRHLDLRLFLMATVVSMVIVGAVGNMFETPFAAIPFYLLMGIGLGVDEAEAVVQRLRLLAAAHQVHHKRFAPHVPQEPAAQTPGAQGRPQRILKT